MEKIRFGTDGWRAVIADGFTVSAVERLSQAAALYWLQKPPADTSRLIVVGYDTRFLSDLFARSVAEVLAGNGFQVVLSDGPCPTPCLSYAVRHRGAAGGVMITASHNPGIFNGFKLKSHFGGAADEPTLRGVEECLDTQPIRRTRLGQAVAAGTIVLRDLHKDHFAAIRRKVDWTLVKRARMRIAHDAMYGVGAGCFEALLKDTACRVTGIHDRRDPLFGGRSPEPIPANYAETTTFLQKDPHDICLVTDGDADRLGGLNGRGVPLTTHQIICLLLHHLVVNRGETGRVVKALTTSSMVNRICEAHGLPLTETGVGFKFICAEMVRGDVLAGVEESGGIAIRNHIPERDGLAAGLLLLELLAFTGRSVDTLIRMLERKFGPHRYGRVDLHQSQPQIRNALATLRRCPPERLGRSAVEKVQTFDGLKFIARNGAWLMLRGSGTEPVVRIYAEAQSDAAVSALLCQGRRLLKSG